MTTRAFKACAQPGCPAILRDGGRCAAHARPAWGGKARPNRQARGYDAEYERNRKTVLTEETHCRLCGGPGLPDDQADHIKPLVEGGTNERENLGRAHRACNLKRGSAHGGRGRRVFLAGLAALLALPQAQPRYATMTLVFERRDGKPVTSSIQELRDLSIQNRSTDKYLTARGEWA